MRSPLSGFAASPRSLRAARYGRGDNASSRRRSGNGVCWKGGLSERGRLGWALVLLTAAALLLSACGHTGRAASKERRLDDAIKACRATHQRVQLIGANGTDNQQGGYTNIQDSSGRRQTAISDPGGGSASWYRCVP